MRQDQILTLSGLSEKLADVVIDEVDPDAWPGAGMPISEISKEERGDRYWCKKNAHATLSLLSKVEELIADQNGTGLRIHERSDDELDKEIARAEREAEKLLDKVGKAAKRKLFMKHTLPNGQA